MIPSYGPAHAKIMLVMDCPLSGQIASQDFMGGYVGSYISKLFKHVEGGHGALYKSFLTRDTIPNKTQSPLQYIAEQGIDHSHYLLAEINDLKPNVIFISGEACLQYFTGLTNVAKYRGSILPLSGLIKPKLKFKATKIVPLISFESLRKDIRQWYIMRSDITKGWKYKDDSEPFKEHAYLWICRSSKALKNYLDRNRSPEYLATDIEMWNNYIDCISLCADGYEGVSIPLLGDLTMTSLELALIYQQIAEYLGSGVPIINQNVRFDEWHYRKYGFVLGNVVGDTMILGATLYPELPKGLGFYNSLYTTLTYYKDEGKEVHPLSSKKDNRYIYNAKDAVAAHQCFTGMRADAKELNVWEFYNKGPRQFYFTYRGIERNGVRFSEENQDRLRNKYEAIYESCSLQYTDLVGKSINVNSPLQVKRLLYEDLELPEQKETVVRPSGERYIKYKVDEETLEYLALNHTESDDDTKSILYLVIYLRKLKRILSYLDILVHPDGRIRTRYKESGTESGRTSTTFSEDVFYNAISETRFERKRMGIALQTVPKHGFRLLDGTVLGEDLRTMFVPDNEYIFGEADFKQMEARIVTICCKDWKTLERFDNIPAWTAQELQGREVAIKRNPKDPLASKADIHVMTTAQVLSKPEHLVTKDEREHKGKRARHAGNYGMQAFRLSQMAQISVKEATDVLKLFHSTNPLIQKVFHRTVQELIRNTRSMTNLFSRRRDFLQRVDMKTFKVAYSYFPQSTCSDTTKFAMLRISERVKDSSFMWLGEFHDGVWWQSKQGEYSKHQAIVQEEMERAISFKKGSFAQDFEYVFPVDTASSKESWGEMS